MLIEFKVSNYRSFRGEETLSMVASRDTSHPDNLIECDGYKLIKSAALYGSNASGKSNLIKAMSAMEKLVLASATRMNLGDPIDVSPFRLDAELRKQPSRFEVTVLLDGTLYIYGFSATSERVHDEWLKVRRPGGKLTPWFERTYDAETKQTTWSIKGPLKKEAESLKAKTRDNCLLLSRGAEQNITIFAPIFNWMGIKHKILDLSAPQIMVGQFTARRLIENENLNVQIHNLIRNADFGITGIRIAEVPAFQDVPKNAPEDLKAVISSIKKLAGGENITKFSVLTEHVCHLTGDSVSFSLEEESNGTQRYFSLLGPVLEALNNGFQLIIDELDCSMHPNLTRKIIELFQSSEWNQKGAQLIFSTHDSSLMQSSLFRRDQLWLTEKRNDGSTDLFSLNDIEAKPRNSEALEKNYLTGSYGGVPKFGPTLERIGAE